jgi:hypothetical protein
VTIAVATIDEGHYRYVAARVLFSSNPPTGYVEALKGSEVLDDDLSAGDYFGFHVDAGLATIVDAAVRDAFCDFKEKWSEEHPDDEIYDDYYADLFEASAREHPEFQRSGGDWINWQIPGTDYTVPMFASGWGDGSYPVYFALDATGGICQLLIEFISLEYLAEQE